MNKTSLSIGDLLKDVEYGLNLTLSAGSSGLVNRVFTPRIQKPGLALTGYTEHLHPDRVQILGNTEISYLRQLSANAAEIYIGKICSFPISCFIVTTGLEPPALLREFIRESRNTFVGDFSRIFSFHFIDDKIP